MAKTITKRYLKLPLICAAFVVAGPLPFASTGLAFHPVFFLQNYTSSNSCPSSGLVASYPFSEGSGTTTADTSGGSNTGTLQSATWTASGHSGNALDFTSSYVNVPNAGTLNPTSAITLMAWARPASDPAVNEHVLIAKNDASNMDVCYFMEAYDYFAASGRPSGAVRIGGSYKTVTAGTTKLTVGQWAHVAVTYDGSNVKIYINGTLEGTLAASGSIDVCTGPLQIGNTTVWGEEFNGSIDEARVYDRALSAAEITQSMNSPSCP